MCFFHLCFTFPSCYLTSQKHNFTFGTYDATKKPSKGSNTPFNHFSNFQLVKGTVKNILLAQHTSKVYGGRL